MRGNAKSGVASEETNINTLIGLPSQRREQQSASLTRNVLSNVGLWTNNTVALGKVGIFVKNIFFWDVTQIRNNVGSKKQL
jgi:hypothetical protein